MYEYNIYKHDIIWYSLYNIDDGYEFSTYVTGNMDCWLPRHSVY